MANVPDNDIPGNGFGSRIVQFQPPWQPQFVNEINPGVPNNGAAAGSQHLITIPLPPQDLPHGHLAQATHAVTLRELPLTDLPKLPGGKVVLSHND